MLNLLGSFAEFERQIMLERQRAGIARAKADAIMALHGQGVAAAEIAQRWEVRRASVYRVIEDARAKAEGKVQGP
jgi:DNA invertase Pin-like site-specific DNA recombinase